VIFGDVAKPRAWWLGVEDKFELCRLLYCQVLRLCTVQRPIGVICAPPVVVNSVRPVANEPIDEFAIAVDGRQASLCSTSRRGVGPRRSEPLPP
jgi:hypothetical protein